jgi:single-strand DNA-binding protein
MKEVIIIMMSLNRTILVGRLAQDPEVRYTANEIPVARFALAVGRPSKNGEKEVDFINIVAWRGLAKVCGEYLKKGKPVAVEGRLQVRKYEKEGEKRTMTEVIASNMQMLDSKFSSKTSDDKHEAEDEAVEIEEAAPAKKK